MIPKILIPFDKMIPVDATPESNFHWTTSCFQFKLSEIFTPCDYDRKEKTIEVEFQDGKRIWLPFSFFFGKVISEAEKIYMLHSDDNTEPLEIVGVSTVRVKRTNYLRINFSNDIPF